MDKATQKSIEWQKANHPIAIGGDAFTDMVDSFNVNPAFVAGYKEAEKALALTWIDIRNIVRIAEKLNDENKTIPRKYGFGQQFWEAVLGVFNESNNK